MTYKFNSPVNQANTDFQNHKLLWQLSIACFILAGVTGFTYRLGLVGVDLWGLSLDNIRHAHSHLMFFCWAVPLPMYFIIRKVEKERVNTGSKGMKIMIRMALCTLLLGLASYPFFLFYGYRPVAFAGMELPFSVILSGLVMICWYGFMIGYWRARKNVTSDLAILFYDSSLVMLFISSLGAWGVALVQFSGMQIQLFSKVLTHFFLATFTEGWVVLVLLGILYDRLGIAMDQLKIPSGLLAGLILFGAPLTFPYGISASWLSPQLLMAARLGGLLAATGLLLNVYVLSRYTPIRLAWQWKAVLIVLGLKAIGQFMASLIPANFWLSEHGLRIFYLHLLLLGSFTMVLFSALSSSKNIQDALKLVFGSIVLVLVSLIWLTLLWPRAWFSAWHFYATTVIALLPSLAALYYFMVLLQQQNKQFE